MKSNNRKGSAFTLVEVLVVVGVIAILAALLLPALSSARAEALFTTDRAKLRSIQQAVALYGPESEKERVNDLRVLVDAGLLAPRDIVQQCDRTAIGAWNLYESNSQSSIRPNPLRPERQSFLIKKVGTGLGAEFSEFLSGTEGAGWLATGCHPLEPADEDISLLNFNGPRTRSFVSKHLRLTYAGGTVTRRAQSISAGPRSTSFGLFHYFTDEPSKAHAWLKLRETTRK